MAQHPPQPDTTAAAAAGASTLPTPVQYHSSQRRWRSTELLGSAQEIEIEHGQAVYRLRLTALGKLILTK